MPVQYTFSTNAQTNPPPPAISPDYAVMLRYFLNSPLTLPIAENPVVSVIIPVFNQFEYTIACLHSLVNACAGNVSYEVILADDGSTDRTQEIARQVANLRIVRNDSNQHGFLPNVNFAAQFARGGYLFFLNNDTLMLENGGFLEHLTARFADPTVGLVGNRLMNEKGELQHSVSLCWSGGLLWDFFISNQAVNEGDAVEGAAFMLPSATWRELGGFDPAYGRGYFEESDLCLRIKTQKRQRILCDMQSQIIHFGQRTFQDAGKTPLEFQNNGKFFFRRWHDYLSERERDLPDGDLETKRQALCNKLYLPK